MRLTRREWIDFMTKTTDIKRDRGQAHDSVAIYIADRSGWSSWQPRTKEAKVAAATRLRFNRKQLEANNYDYVAAMTRRALTEFLGALGHKIRVTVKIKKDDASGVD